MHQVKERSLWPWVAVAAILAIAAVAIALIVAARSDSTPTVRASLATTTATTSAAPPKPKVQTQTTTVVQQTKTVTQAAPAAPGPAPGPAPTRASSSNPSLAACDQNISVNGNTSCPFADNVFNQYAIEVQQNGTGSYNVAAYSSAANQDYTDDCVLNSDTQIVDCRHGSDLVQFPEWAAEVYQTH